MRQSTSTWWKQCGDDGEVPDVLVRYAVVHPRDEFVLAHESFVVGQLTDSGRSNAGASGSLSGA
jgi:hypothetical protein